MSTAPARKKPGRKPLQPGESKDTSIVIRTRAEDLAEWDRKAADAGVSRNAWIEATLNKARK